MAAANQSIKITTQNQNDHQIPTQDPDHHAISMVVEDYSYSASTVLNHSMGQFNVCTKLVAAYDVHSRVPQCGVCVCCAALLCCARMQ